MYIKDNDVLINFLHILLLLLESTMYSVKISTRNKLEMGQHTDIK